MPGRVAAEACQPSLVVAAAVVVVVVAVEVEAVVVVGRGTIAVPRQVTLQNTLCSDVRACSGLAG